MNPVHRPIGHRIIAAGFHGEQRTVNDLVDDVMSHRSKRVLTAREVLENKRTWTSDEVAELIVELFDGDEEDED